MKYFILLVIIALFSACSDKEAGRRAAGFFESEERLVSPEHSGRLISLLVDEGDRVDRSQLLAVVDSSMLILQRSKIQATMAAVRAKTRGMSDEVAILLERRDHLRREQQRVERLLEPGAASQKQYDDLDAEIKVIEKQINSVRSNTRDANRSILSELKPLEAQLALIDEQIRRCRIESPLQGRVSTLYLREGEMAIPGKPVLRVAEMDTIIFTAFLTNKQLGKISVGQSLRVYPAIDEEPEPIAAELYWVADEAEFTPKNVQSLDEKTNLVYTVKLRLKNDGRIKDGMPGEIEIPPGVKDDQGE